MKRRKWGRVEEREKEGRRQERREGRGEGEKRGGREGVRRRMGAAGGETPPGPAASYPNQRGPLEQPAVEMPCEPQVPS